MIFNIRNKLLVFLTVTSSLFITINVSCAGDAAQCKYRYYYISQRFNDEFKKSETYTTKSIRIMDIWVSEAYIYDPPILPSSWVYDITTLDRPDDIVSFMSAAAKSDKDTISYKDLENFLIIKQPANKPVKDKIYMKLIILSIGKEGGTFLDNAEVDYEEYTLQKIDKCLPEKSRRH